MMNYEEFQNEKKSVVPNKQSELKMKIIRLMKQRLQVKLKKFNNSKYQNILTKSSDEGGSSYYDRF